MSRFRKLLGLPVAPDYKSWRQAAGLGGPNPYMHERIFPGAARTDVLSEHVARYAFALEYCGGARSVLDLGCGTGYGSEMLSWAVADVRGFDIWEPTAEQRPQWPGPNDLVWGHDLCADPLPKADWAVWFENIEHLPDASAALRLAWKSVDGIIASFPNPKYHGSHMNEFHVTDWSLDQFESELRLASEPRFSDIDILHFHQELNSPRLTSGRDPDASFWVVVARGIPQGMSEPSLALAARLNHEDGHGHSH